MATADVVIIGAGISGLSTAFHLARAGVRRVVVVERRHVAAEATGKSGALVRAGYDDETETRLALEGLKQFTSWRELVGGDCGLRQVGLLILTPPERRDLQEASLTKQRELGVNVRTVSADEAREIDPSLWCADVSHITYEPDAGYADPNAASHSLAKAATDLGVELRLETTVTRVLTTGDKVTGVETTGGTIGSPVVLVAAGAWANKLFEPLGINLDMSPILARVALFRWTAERSPKHATCIDRFGEGSWFRPVEGNHTLVGAESGLGRVGADPDNYSETPSQDYVDRCRGALVRRFPVMKHSTMRGAWAGVLMRSRDSRPIIDRLAHYDGLFCMAADSGTSFKTGPAIGRCLAEWITEGEAKTVDLTSLRSTRFDGHGPGGAPGQEATGATVSR